MKKFKNLKYLRVGYLMPDDMSVEHWVDFQVQADLMRFVRESHDKGYIIFDVQEIYV